MPSRRLRVRHHLLVVTWWTVAVALLVITAVVLLRHVTWYLSIDQFGYLTFARDLRAGRVFHDWPPATALQRYLPERVDVLAQTYVLDHGRLYCRYAPGFPLLLAIATTVFGEDAAHVVNPMLFVATIGLAIAFQRRLLRSRWRALLGAFLLPLLPTMIGLWGLTLTRDVSAHAVAFASLVVLLPWRTARLGIRRAAAAASLLGFAVAIRPDAMLYALPAMVLAAARWRREAPPPAVWRRAVAGAALGFVVGVSPLLAYDWTATGNPFRPTQGMEADRFFSSSRVPDAAAAVEVADARVGYPSPVWHGGTLEPVQGGTLRLANVPGTFHDHLRLLVDVYGPVLFVVILLGMVLTYRLRPLVFFVTVPYVLAALLFYSCWAQADTRYLIGVHLLLVVLLVEGLCAPLDVVRRLADRPRRARRFAWSVAALLAFCALTMDVAGGRSALNLLSRVLPLGAAAALVVAGRAPSRRVAGVLAPALALAVTLLGIVRGTIAVGERAPFQGPEAQRARATVTATLSPGSVVVTTEDVGRPAENLEYYVPGVHALYQTDLARWHVALADAMGAFLAAGMAPYLLLPANVPETASVLQAARRTFDVALVRDIPQERSLDWFVSGPAAGGMHVLLYRVAAR